MDTQTRNELVLEHQPLLKFLLKKLGFNKGTDKDDIEQEAQIALIMAIDNYDPEKGSLSTYLSQWIRCLVGRYFERRNRHRGQPFTDELASSLTYRPSSIDEASFQELLDDLPLTQTEREILTGMFLKGEGCNEAGRRLGLTRNQSFHRMKLGLERSRRKLVKNGSYKGD